MAPQASTVATAAIGSIVQALIVLSLLLFVSALTTNAAILPPLRPRSATLPVF